MVKFLVCSECGVAYYVGAKSCTNKWCPLRLEEYKEKTPAIVIPKDKPKKKYKYTRKKIEPHVSRWLGIVTRAKKKSLECDLDLDDVKYIIDSPCIYCNSKERIEVDRMNSNKGYTKLNTVPACRRCNTIKNNVVTYEEMMTIVDILGWRV